MASGKMRLRGRERGGHASGMEKRGERRRTSEQHLASSLSKSSLDQSILRWIEQPGIVDDQISSPELPAKNASAIDASYQTSHLSPYLPFSAHLRTAISSPPPILTTCPLLPLQCPNPSLSP